MINYSLQSVNCNLKYYSRFLKHHDKHGEKAGFYVAHLDGIPAGYIKNNRTGAELQGFCFNIKFFNIWSKFTIEIGQTECIVEC